MPLYSPPAGGTPSQLLDPGNALWKYDSSSEIAWVARNAADSANANIVCGGFIARDSILVINYQLIGDKVYLLDNGWDSPHGARVASDSIHGWSSTTAANGAVDTALIRSAAGRVKATDGSTGLGELLFKLPTSDPVIAGALWNNAGTITISAG